VPYDSCRAGALRQEKMREQHEAYDRFFFLCAVRGANDDFFFFFYTAPTSRCCVLAFRKVRCARGFARHCFLLPLKLVKSKMDPASMEKASRRQGRWEHHGGVLMWVDHFPNTATLNRVWQKTLAGHTRGDWPSTSENLPISKKAFPFFTIC
jgi:hypothetical protein